MLKQAGWKVQDKKAIDFSAGLGIAVREYPTDIGPADYVLFVDRKPLGIIEAKPETFKEWMTHEKSLRARMLELPPLEKQGLRDCQTSAIENLDKSFKDNFPRALIQMATGSGKTYTAITSIYRLLKFANAKRVSFL